MRLPRKLVRRVAALRPGSGRAGRLAPRSEAFQAFSHWHKTPLAKELYESEKESLAKILPTLFGFHLLLIGDTGSADILQSSPISHRITVGGGSPSLNSENISLVSTLNALPLQSNSVDVVIVNHALEFSHDPRGVLREAVRVLRPGGHLLLLGFQPLSLWGIKHLFFRTCQRLNLLSPRGPWGGRFLSQQRLRDWFALLEIQARPTRFIKHGLALEHPWLRAKFGRSNAGFERWLASRATGDVIPCGAVALLWGVKESRPLTPAGSSWKTPIKSPLPVSVAPLREGPSESKMW